MSEFVPPAQGDAASAEWRASTEARLEALTAQVRGLLQVQAQLRTPRRDAGPAAPRTPGRSTAETRTPSTATSRERSRAVRRRVAQCELEDLREENARLRRRIRELMESQRDANLSGVMLLAFVLLAAAVLFHMFLQHRAPAPASDPTTPEIV